MVTHRLLIEGVISKNLKREAILDGLKASLKREKEWNYETKPERNSNKNSIKWQHIQTYLKSFQKCAQKYQLILVTADHGKQEDISMEDTMG